VVVIIFSSLVLANAWSLLAQLLQVIHHAFFVSNINSRFFSWVKEILPWVGVLVWRRDLGTLLHDDVKVAVFLRLRHSVLFLEIKSERGVDLVAVDSEFLGLNHVLQANSVWFLI